MVGILSGPSEVEEKSNSTWWSFRRAAMIVCGGLGAVGAPATAVFVPFEKIKDITTEILTKVAETTDWVHDLRLTEISSLPFRPSAYASAQAKDAVLALTGASYLGNALAYTAGFVAGAGSFVVGVSTIRAFLNRAGVLPANSVDLAGVVRAQLPAEAPVVRAHEMSENAAKTAEKAPLYAIVGYKGEGSDALRIIARFTAEGNTSVAFKHIPTGRFISATFEGMDPAAIVSLFNDSDEKHVGIVSQLDTRDEDLPKAEFDLDERRRKLFSGPKALTSNIGKGYFEGNLYFETGTHAFVVDYPKDGESRIRRYHSITSIWNKKNKPFNFRTGDAKEVKSIRIQGDQKLGPEIAALLAMKAALGTYSFRQDDIQRFVAKLGKELTLIFDELTDNARHEKGAKQTIGWVHMAQRLVTGTFNPITVTARFAQYLSPAALNPWRVLSWFSQSPLKDISHRATEKTSLLDSGSKTIVIRETDIEDFKARIASGEFKLATEEELGLVRNQEQNKLADLSGVNPNERKSPSEEAFKREKALSAAFISLYAESLRLSPSHHFVSDLTADVKVSDDEIVPDVVVGTRIESLMGVTFDFYTKGERAGEIVIHGGHEPLLRMLKQAGDDVSLLMAKQFPPALAAATNLDLVKQLAQDSRAFWAVSAEQDDRKTRRALAKGDSAWLKEMKEAFGLKTNAELLALPFITHAEAGKKNSDSSWEPSLEDGKWKADIYYCKRVQHNGQTRTINTQSIDGLPPSWKESSILEGLSLLAGAVMVMNDPNISKKDKALALAKLEHSAYLPPLDKRDPNNQFHCEWDADPEAKKPSLPEFKKNELIKRAEKTLDTLSKLGDSTNLAYRLTKGGTIEIYPNLDAIQKGEKPRAVLSGLKLIDKENVLKMFATLMPQAPTGHNDDNGLKRFEAA